MSSPDYPQQLTLDSFLEQYHQKLKEYMCPLCKGIYVNPVLDNCAHIFCKQCFNIYYNSFKTLPVLCPLSKGPLDLNKVKDFDFITSEICNFQIYCPYKSRGCKWVGDFCKRELHSDECQFKEVKCSNQGCGCIFMKCEQEKHNAECNFAPVTCQKCHMIVIKGKLEQHSTECPNEILKCLCGKELLRKDLIEHEKKECAEEEVLCGFSIYGCDKKFKRKSKEEHLLNNVLEHNDLFIKWFVEAKEKKDKKFNERYKRLMQRKEKIDKIEESLQEMIKQYNDNMI